MKVNCSFYGCFFVLLTTFLGLSCSEGDKSSEISAFEGNLRGGTGYKELVLTFDDGPTRHTADVLDLLRDLDIKATFFVKGANVRAYPQLVQRMKDEGHLVANHTMTHPKMSKISHTENIEQVLQTHDLIKRYVADDAFFFRAPYGDWRLWIGDALNNAGLDFYVGNVLWDIGGTLTESYAADWNCWSVGLSTHECGRRYLNEIKYKKSGIVLFHDVTSKTTRMLRYILPQLADSGYKMTRLDKIEKYSRKLKNRNL